MTVRIEVMADPARTCTAMMLTAAIGGGDIVLTGGSTPRAAYERFASEATAIGLDLSRTTLWLGDERCVAPDDERSNYRMIKESMLDPLAGALASLGCRHAFLVWGKDGLDEVTLDGPTRVRVVEPGTVRELVWSPDDFGLPRVHASELKISGPEASADGIRGMLAGNPGPVRAIVLANAAAALWTISPGPLPSLVDRAARAVDSQAAARLVERWSKLTREGR